MGRLVRTVIGVSLLFVPGMQAVGTSILLAEAATIIGPKPPKNRQKPQTLTARSANMPGQVIYGEPRTSGMLYIPTPGTSGSNREYLHYIVVLACHEVDAIGDIWLDTDHIPAADIDGSGNVTDGKFAGKLIVEKYLGTDDQLASTMLTDAIPNWDADFRGRGIAYLHLRMERDDTAFPSGPPQNVFARVRGRKVYDPRNGLTAWSDNAALCVRDYLTNFLPSAAAVDETLAGAAASICAETMTVPGGTQSRYACNGILSTGEDPKPNIENLLSSMNGALTYVGGQFQIYAGAYDAPLHTIDASWLAGPLDIQLHTPGDKLFNVVRGSYIDPERNFQEVEHEIQTIASYVTQDGERLETERAYPFTANEYQAQRQSYQTLLKSRGQRTIQAPLNLRGLNIKPWQTVNVSLSQYGITGVYRVVGWQHGGTTPVTVTLVEESAGYYAAPTYLTPQTVTVVGTQLDSPLAPNNFAIQRLTDGNLISWTNPPSRQFREIVVYRSLTDDFGASVEVARVRGTSYLDPTPTAFYYWVRATDGTSFSATLPPSGGAQGGSSDPGASLAVSLSHTSRSAVFTNGVTGSITGTDCFATGGVPPYAYSWIRVSGSTDITAVSPTAASTAFSCVTGTSETKSAVFKCEVTDSDGVPTVLDSPNITLFFAFQAVPVGGGGSGGFAEP